MQRPIEVGVEGRRTYASNLGFMEAGVKDKEQEKAEATSGWLIKECFLKSALFQHTHTGTLVKPTTVSSGSIGIGSKEQTPWDCCTSVSISILVITTPLALPASPLYNRPRQFMHDANRITSASRGPTISHTHATTNWAYAVLGGMHVTVILRPLKICLVFVVVCGWLCPGR